MNLTSSKKVSSGLSELTASVVTVATFAKWFVPFYLIGSTIIFAATSALGLVLASLQWRMLLDQTKRLGDIFLILALLYLAVIASFILHSYGQIPPTHLIGILIFHGLFLLFGLSAARALPAVLWTLLAFAAIYLIVIIEYTVRFGDLMRGGFLQDLFGVGDANTYITFHQNIGVTLGLGALAAFGLATSRTRNRAALCLLIPIFALLFYIAARAALVGLLCTFAFVALAALWHRSRQLTLVIALALTLAATVGSVLFYREALIDTNVDQKAPDAISRTIREIQDPRPGFRLQIWQRTWHAIVTEPQYLVLGRGIGMFSVNDGAGAPDWLLRPTEGSKHYPHNLHLELLYETGIVGAIPFTILIILPLAFALRRWSSISSPERYAFAIYLFMLLNSEISGGFAYNYPLQFFLGLVCGIIAIERSQAGQRNHDPFKAAGMRKA